MNAQIYRKTINSIENIYMINCQPEWIEYWKNKRKEMFAKLIELQLKEFDYEKAPHASTG